MYVFALIHNFLLVFSCKAFQLDNIDDINPFIIFLDHLSETAWYLWLTKDTTQTRRKLQKKLPVDNTFYNKFLYSNRTSILYFIESVYSNYLSCRV